MLHDEVLEHAAGEIGTLAEALAGALGEWNRVGPEHEPSQAVADTAARLTSRLTHWRRRGVTMDDQVARSMAGAGEEIRAVIDGLKMWEFRPGSALSAMRKQLTALLWELEKQTMDSA